MASALPLFGMCVSVTAAFIASSSPDRWFDELTPAEP